MSGGSIAAAARPGGVERPRTVAARRSIPGDVYRELAPVDLTVVEEPDRLGRFHVAGELDEREAARAARLAIGRQVDLYDAARLGQKLRQGILRGPDIQIADEDTSCNGSVSPVDRGVDPIPFGMESVVKPSRRAARTASAALISSANMPTWSGQGGSFASTYWHSSWLHWTSSRSGASGGWGASAG